MRTLVKIAALLAIVTAAASGAVVWRLHGRDGQATSFRTAQVTRGDLVVTVSATGTIEPEEVVDVGAQAGGQIVSFGQDADGKAALPRRRDGLPERAGGAAVTVLR